MSPLVERTRGRWRGILLALGVESKYLSGKNTPCPFCGGRDRFRFVDKEGDGFWICSQCGSGDGPEFVKRKFGVDFADAAKRVEAVIGTAPIVKPKGINEEKRKAELNALWRSSSLLTLNDPAGRYLTRRGLVPPLTGTALRWSKERGAMLAKVVAPDGTPVTVQQTFLDAHGVKIERKTFWGRHPLGSAVQLAQPSDGVIGIAEGVETALSATTLFGLATWAALDAHHLERWVPPRGVSHVAIFGDNDESFTGQAAAYALAKRLRLEKKLVVDVRLPELRGTDWNDVLQEQRHEPQAMGAVN